MEKTSLPPREIKSRSAIGVIPARFGSTRFPGKVLSPIQGKPLVQHIWENAHRSKKLQEVVIAVDDERVKSVVEKFGAKAVMTPSDLASGTDRVAKVVKDWNYEIVLNLQADEPLLNTHQIDQLVATLEENPKWDLATLAFWEKNPSLLTNPHIVKCVVSQEMKALYFSRQSLKSDLDGRFLKHIGIYGYRKESLLRLADLPPSKLELAEKLEQLRALENGFSIGVAIINKDLVSVDIPSDIEKVESILRENAKVIS
jgi:3-deoxy-manno-octulosonate cytidylyltransferase (CMP-KDO synthetase)